MKSCSKCGGTASDTAIKCPKCRSLLVAPISIASATDYKAYAHLVTSPGYTASQTPAWMLQATESCIPVANGGAHASRGALSS